MKKEELVNYAMEEFERAKKFGMPHHCWIPFKQAFYRGYELGKKEKL